MNLDILREELKRAKYTGLTYEQCAALLNTRPLLDNPTPQPDRPRLITWRAFLDALTAGDVAKVYASGMTGDVRAALDSNDRAIAGSLWRGLKTILAAGSITAIEAAMAQTEKDPAWSAKIAGQSWADANLGRAVTPSDVQAALHTRGG